MCAKDRKRIARAHIASGQTECLPKQCRKDNGLKEASRHLGDGRSSLFI